MRQNERITGWELTDPKPPVVQSGHMENRVQHLDKTQKGVDKTDDSGL